MRAARISTLPSKSDNLLRVVAGVIDRRQRHGRDQYGFAIFVGGKRTIDIGLVVIVKLDQTRRGCHRQGCDRGLDIGRGELLALPRSGF